MASPINGARSVKGTRRFRFITEFMVIALTGSLYAPTIYQLKTDNLPLVFSELLKITTFVYATDASYYT